MAITVYKFPQPYLELELVEGGSLSSGQEYFFLGWFQRHGGYYHGANSPVSEEQSITPTGTTLSIKCSWWAYHGSITAFADAGGGQVTVTSAGHGLSEDASVKIIGTTNYNGTFTATNVTDDTFEIADTWVSDDATGTWLNTNSIPTEVTESYTSTSGMCFKWDKYSMINSTTGKPYKWLNMNDPANSGKDEFDETDGHRKWQQQYGDSVSRSGGSVTWTKEATSGTTTTELHDGNAQGVTGYGSRGQGHIRIAQKYIVAYYGSTYDSQWDIDCILHIKIDTTDTNNNWDDLCSALIASGYTENYRLDSYGGYYVSLHLIGAYDGEGVGTWTNVTLDSSGGWRGTNITYDNCQIRYLPVHNMCRTSGGYAIRGNMKNTSFFYNGNAMDLYPLYPVADGFSPFQTITFYDDCIGYTFNAGQGGYLNPNVYFQFRYPNDGPRVMTDVTANGIYFLTTYSASSPIQSLTLERYNANNNGIVNYDASISYSYCDDKVCEFIWNCVDVTSNRADGKFVVYFAALNEPTSYSDIWYFRYNINLTIVDEDGTAIEGASVSLIGDETSTDTTDASGEATVTQLGYTVTCPQDVGTSSYGTPSDWKTADLTISKAGYGTYKLLNIEIKEGQDWTIKLPASGTQTKIYDSTIYSSTIY